jgi:hypothetical protein
VIVTGPVACLFRVKLEVLSAEGAKEYPVVTPGFVGFDVLSINVAANNADAAVAAAHESVRVSADCSRLISVRLLHRVDLLATPGLVPPAASGPSTEHGQPARPT